MCTAGQSTIILAITQRHLRSVALNEVRDGDARNVLAMAGVGGGAV
jgi:hypothetical protein